ncbi:hypothetical protein JCM8547_002736 [Rhodosporidiobolus lusitaniae]
MMQVAIWMRESFPSDLLNRGVPILLAFSMGGVDELPAVSHFQHFLLEAWRDSDDEHLLTFCKPKEALQKLVEAVANHAQINSLSLPSQLHPSSIASLAPDQHSIRDDLLTTCSLHNVHVIWRLRGAGISGGTRRS